MKEATPKFRMASFFEIMFNLIRHSETNVKANNLKAFLLNLSE